MSSYFDRKAVEIRDMISAKRSPYDNDVHSWINSLRIDIAVACEYDRGGPNEMPAEIRDGCYKAFLRHSLDAWPCGVPGFGVDFETDEQGMRLLSNLVECLHDFFHAAAHLGWFGGDNPLAPMYNMDAKMETRCVELIVADSSLTLAPLPPFIAENIDM